MRRLFTVFFAMTLVLASVRADDEKKDDVKSPDDQWKELRQDFMKERTAVIRAVNAADKDKQEEMFYAKMGELLVSQLPKFMAFAKANAANDSGFNALMFVFQNSGGEMPNKETAAKIGVFADESLKALLEQHEAKLVSRPAVLEGAGDRGMRVLRALREKLKSGEGHVRVTASLANMLKMPTERADNDEKAAKAANQASEAEALFVEVIAKGAEIPALNSLVTAAKANLAELQTLGIGKVMPELESKDLDDKPVKLSDLRGKVVVVDVWATWCGPCKAMIPHERELVARMAGKPFALISVSCDEKKETLTEFLETEKMPWTHWWDGKSGPVIKTLNLKYFPTIYVIDSKGVIRYRGARGPAMDAAVEKLMKETQASE